MNGSDWFALTRNGRANVAWGEGWASAGSWGFVGHEVVSYYAAWVECAARSRNLLAGFYIVGTMGGVDKKIFSLLSHGIKHMMLYSWGPRYIGAEGSNFWSERRETYVEAARATHAIGPADEIIGRGKRWPRRVALLYNRTHEIWNSAFGGFQTDRLLTFMALTHAHITVDIIIEEDLNDETLNRYRVLYIQGFNLPRRCLAAIRRWVESRGILVAHAGSATRDEYDNPNPEADKLFGASQRFAGVSKGNWHPQSLPKHEPIDKISLKASELTPALEPGVIGVKYVLMPTTGRAVGKFSNGDCAAVLHAVGKGKTLLLGVTPGHIYKGRAAGSSRYTLSLRPLITFPAERTLGPPRVECSKPQTEICLFEHEKGIAITLCNFAFPGDDTNSTLSLKVRPNREVNDVVSALNGRMAWRKGREFIQIEVPLPRPVDVIIIR